MRARRHALTASMFVRKSCYLPCCTTRYVAVYTTRVAVSAVTIHRHSFSRHLHNLYNTYTLQIYAVVYRQARHQIGHMYM